MSLLRRQAVALPLATVVAGEAAAQTGWIVVQASDNSFLVDMPGRPLYKVIDTATPAGTAFVYHSYSLEYRRLSFVAQTAFYPAEVDVLRPRANLQRRDRRRIDRPDRRRQRAAPTLAFERPPLRVAGLSRAGRRHARP